MPLVLKTKAQLMYSEVGKYLQQGRVLQLATVAGDQPWVCTVYFVADEELNLYWLSWPERRHSKELAENPRAAITIAIKHDLPVIGLGAEGTVSVVTDQPTVKKVIDRYIEKYDEGQKFYERFLSGDNHHQMYKFSTSKFVLFDEVNFPNNGSIDLNV